MEAGEHQDEHREDGRADLAPPRKQDLAPHLPEAGQRDLEPDGEQQEGDADFREGVHHARFRDESGAGGTQDRARDEKRRHGGQTEPPEQQGHGGGDRQDDRQVPQDKMQVHR